MKLLFWSLQLASLCALSSWSASSDSKSVIVTQDEEVTVEEGQTAEISCCWTEGNERTRVTWKKSGKTVKNKITNTSCSELTFTNVSKADEGTYICNVTTEIPFLGSGLSNGTVVKVKSKNETVLDHETNPGVRTSLYALIGLAAVAPILLVALICVCRLQRRRAGAARVIYEEPHFDSETQDVDKRSTGSSGSSQWCQVLLYDSVDYFQQTESRKT
ncbi:unnamed protein product [Knipowitschia caucasica]